MDRILITGISGFIARHTAALLLREGRAVVGTVRDPARADAARASLAAQGAPVERLSFVTADLSRDEGWAAAAVGCDAVLHMASPFPIKAPKDREALVPAARDGALRVLRAAADANVGRVVMTSSVAAIMYRAGRPPVFHITEDDWTDPEWTGCSAYVVSKTRAERAAWDFMEQRGMRARLTMVNPGLVLGPCLDAKTAASLDAIALFMRGAYPAVPNIAMPVVDVRDVAMVHVGALQRPETGGRRLIAGGDTLSMLEMCRILREEFPQYAKKIPTRGLPNVLARMLALVDSQVRSILCDLDTRVETDAGYVEDMTGVTFRPAREALVAAAQSMIGHGVV